MKVSLNWLKEYIDVQLPAERICQVLTDCGLEVESIHEYVSVRGGLKGLLVGEVLLKAKHPNADKLNLAQVDIGDKEPLNIVCGAPNLEQGQMVVVAPVGTEIFPVSGDSFKIKETKIRGELSQGMICAEDEIGLGNEHDGIMVLDSKAKKGMPAKDYFEVYQDTIIDIGLTPNRIDGASHMGVARDLVAALSIQNPEFSSKMKRPSVDAFKTDNNSLPIQINVVDTKSCPRYSGLSISGIKVKSSPEWLKNKLTAIGLGPINNIVDITNYVLHETGQPMHAFDAKEIKGNKIIVQTAKKGEGFKTLDEETRTLSNEDLMVCNAEESMCLAGVLGGLKSGVSNDTTEVFLESAHFDPTSIRKSAKRHSIHTDSSFRFERGADPNMTIYSLKRAACLIKEIAGGEISSEIIDVYPKEIENFTVEFSLQNCDRLIGQKIERKTIRRILELLDMQILSEKGEVYSLSIPPYRYDVNREADVIEEVLRIYGYNQVLMPSSARFAMIPNAKKQDDSKNNVASALVGAGFVEIMTNSITKSGYYLDKNPLIKILNPLNSELDVMRGSMLFGGLEAILRNQNHQRSNLKFFEFGSTYSVENGSNYCEMDWLSVFVVGEQNKESWNTENNKTDIFQLKGILSFIVSRLGIEKPGINQIEFDSEYLIGQEWEILKKKVISFGQVRPAVLKKIGIKTNVFYAEVNWGMVIEILRIKNTKHRSLPRYPEVRRDMALLLDENKKYIEIEKLAKKTEKRLIKAINLFDVYQGEKLPEGKKSYAVSFIFQDENKTLQDVEIDSVMKKLTKVFTFELGAEIR